VASINEFENPPEDAVPKPFVIEDVAGFVTSLDEACFSDFLELASYLHSKSYKDAAAVICGGVLEGHLRKLSEKLKIAVAAEDGLPKNTDSLNAELALEGAYSKLDQNNVTAWLELRNDAVRGDYERYTRDQVAFLLKGVRALLSRYPA
jgi:hypothetical protein